MERGFKVGSLGEIAIRCVDLDPMVAYYRDIIGLDVLRAFPDRGIVFFKVAEGFAGHTTVLALFADGAGTADTPADPRKPPIAGAHSSLHHIALGLTFAEQDGAMRWYEANGIAYTVETFDWIGWRGVFTIDPEGNTVELVAYDPAHKA
jgi:catechol 2,3-dioxygenase-like lactoylglutathione lyase family enzyme